MPRADLRRAQREQESLPVAESEARHRALVDALPEPVLLQDVDGTVILANDAARAALGITADGRPVAGTATPLTPAAGLPRQPGPAEAGDAGPVLATGPTLVTGPTLLTGTGRASGPHGGAMAVLREGAAEAAAGRTLRTGRVGLGPDAAVPAQVTYLPLIGDDGRAGAVVTRLEPVDPSGESWPHSTSGATAGAATGTGTSSGRNPGTAEITLPAQPPAGDELFRHAMQYSPIGFGVAALNGRFLRVNHRLCRMLGYRADELQERTLYDVIHPDDLEETSLQVGHLMRGDMEAVTLQRRYRGHGDMQLWGTLSICVIRDAQARPVQFVVQIEDASEIRRAQELLTHMTLHDPLSGMPNRTLVLDRIRDGLDRSARTNRRVAVLHCDVDQFRVINDSAGQEQGDVVLTEIGRRIGRALRAGDTAGRLGGDEFAVVCTDVADEAEAASMAERVQSSVSTPMRIEDRMLVPSVSIGIALSTTSEADPISLLRDAEIAGHRAKERGRNRWDMVDSGMRRRALERLDLEQGLRVGLESGELELHFQPIVDVENRQVVGREALLRWHHPERGLLAPGHFLQVAEESGLIGDIGQWVLTEAARVAAAAGPERGYVSINVSPSQVTRPGLAASVEKALAEVGLPPERLMVELTESVMLSSAPSARQEIQQLDDLGVKVMVDDFGTGFGALSYLRDLPISGIKVDRSFTAGLGTDRPSERIVEALTGLGRGLGVDVIVEGVETEEQRTRLRQLGAEHAQGYLFGRPVPEEPTQATG